MIGVNSLPMKNAMKTWDALSTEEINARLEQSEQDIAAGRVYPQTAMDAMMKSHLDRSE